MSIFVSWQRAIYIGSKPSGKSWELTASARKPGELSGVKVFRGEDVVFEDFVKHLAEHHPIDAVGAPPAESLFKTTAFLIAALLNNLYGFHILRAELYDSRFLDAFERQYETLHAIEMAALLAGLPPEELQVLERDALSEYERGGDWSSEASQIRRFVSICRMAGVIDTVP